MHTTLLISTRVSTSSKQNLNVNRPTCLIDDAQSFADEVACSRRFQVGVFELISDGAVRGQGDANTDALFDAAVFLVGTEAALFVPGHLRQADLSVRG